MNRRTLMAVLAVVALGFVTGSTAEAGGGGGTKKSVTIRVNNGQVGQPDQGVIVLPKNQVPNGLWTPAQFIAAGGQTVSGGNTVSFKLAPGWGNVWVIGNVVGPVYNVGAPAPYTVSAGKTYTYLLGGTDLVPTVKQQ